VYFFNLIKFDLRKKTFVDVVGPLNWQKLAMQEET
jgi:hypothetical protein